ncbi:unnamed protein product [Owenia fusiformis]|uniref:Uncharacterized protein n=1 Tax=Owenia fusiformis TaxID=6347 RepID=A0A8J1Y085_OWEFU|nr:unnamed protein product [Owenia fusiformis]
MIEISIPSTPMLDNRTYNESKDDDFTNESQLQYFRDILQIYKKHIPVNEMDVPMSGGIQHLMNKTCVREQPRARQPGQSETESHINNMPDSVLLHIFSYLDVENLCRMTEVCHRWLNVSSDNILWQQRLESDVKSWSIIGHTTNPTMYKECQSDWSNKEIYLRCSPQVNNLKIRENLNFHYISSLLRSFLPKKVPKVAMFGPGLESSTSGLVRQILWDTSGVFTRIGMFPGQFDGVGGGFSLKLKSGCMLHLSTLYTSTKREREQVFDGNRLRNNRLIAVQQAEEGAIEDIEQYELRQSVKDLCRTLDAFIFVVDATESIQNLELMRRELFALVNERWAAPSIPVLVLSCIQETSTQRVPCIDVVTALNMTKLNRPWQVHDVQLSCQNKIGSSIQWLVEQAQRV